MPCSDCHPKIQPLKIHFCIVVFFSLKKNRFGRYITFAFAENQDLKKTRPFLNYVTIEREIPITNNNSTNY